MFPPARSIFLSHSSVDNPFLLARPATLTLALEEASELFPDLGPLALRTKLGGRDVTLTNGAWGVAALQRDGVEFEVVETEGGFKRDLQQLKGSGSGEEGSQVELEERPSAPKLPRLPASSSATSSTSDASSPSIKVKDDFAPSGAVQPALPPPFFDGNQDDDPAHPALLLVFREEGTYTTFRLRRGLSTKLGSAIHAVAGLIGAAVGSVWLTYAGFRVLDSHTLLRLEPSMTLEEWEGEEFEIFRAQVGGKPVIYLFPPTHLSTVNITLSLVPTWTLSALYPLSPISRTKDGGSKTSWTVSASPDGTLVDHSSGTSLSYLFWEAHAFTLPPSPPLFPSDFSSNLHSSSFASPPPSFDPSHPLLDETNAILLPFDSFIPYLDKSLAQLTFHTSARTDFIAY